MYNFLHFIAVWTFKLLFVFPILIIVGIAWYALFPIGLMLHLTFCEDANEFCKKLYSAYIETPGECIKAAIFD